MMVRRGEITDRAWEQIERRDGRGRFGGGTSGDALGLASSGCRKLEGAIGYSAKSVSWK